MFRGDSEKNGSPVPATLTERQRRAHQEQADQIAVQGRG